jgi:hypothetical protein
MSGLCPSRTVLILSTKKTGLRPFCYTRFNVDNCGYENEGQRPDILIAMNNTGEQGAAPWHHTITNKIDVLYNAIILV